MTGKEIYDILVSRNVRSLYHANSVKTSLSLIGLGGLASRELVESTGNAQTNQITDAIDREYGIWGDVFMDTVDIHNRISDRNKYGPVLFVLDVKLLAALPASARVLVTRLNPSKWGATRNDEERYFLNASELSNGLDIGNFDQMLVIRTADKIVPFGSSLQAIVLDEPKLGTDCSQEYRDAETALNNAASRKGINVVVSQRKCSPCGCVSSYSAPATRIPWFFGSR